MLEAPLQDVETAPAEMPEQTFFKTNLRLTEAQRIVLVQRALDRIDEVKSEMGLEDHGQVRMNSWMWERQKNQFQWDNQWEWRGDLGDDPIFKYSNFSPNIAKRYARLLGAKVSDDLIGTDPFFAAMPTTQGMPKKAKQVEWFVQDRISESNLRAGIAEGQQIAISRNEAVIKLTYAYEATRFRGPAKVMVDQAGNAVMTPGGEYIYENDDIIPDPNIQPDAKGVPQAFRLKKDPAVEMPPKGKAIFKDFDDLDQTLVRQDGLDARALDYRDFLCPLNVATVHEADINAHLLDAEFEQMKAKWGLFEVSQDYFNNTTLSGSREPKMEKGEQEAGSKILKWMNCADVYIRFDADGDGVEEEIWLILDITNKKAVFYDYLGNHMKKRPFEVIPGVERVANRWYGVGVFEVLAHKQLFIDTQFNRVNWKSTKAAGVRFRNKNAVEQWKAGDELVFGGDEIYDITDPRFNASNPPLFQVNLNEVDEYAMQLIQLMLQAASTEVGIAGPNDAGMAGLDTTKLATGIKNLERTSNVLMKMTERIHTESINAILDQAVDIILEHMQPRELIYRDDTQELLDLNRDEIRLLPRDVKLLLTRSRSTETLETAQQVIKLCREYYEVLTTFERYKLRGEYIRQLKALEVQDPQQMLEEVTEEQLKAWIEQQKQPPKDEAKKSIATKYDGLERSEQEQVLVSEGIQPASREEVAAGQVREVVLEGQKAAAKAAATPNGSAAKSK